MLYCGGLELNLQYLRCACIIKETPLWRPRRSPRPTWPQPEPPLLHPNPFPVTTPFLPLKIITILILWKSFSCFIVSHLCLHYQCYSLVLPGFELFTNGIITVCILLCLACFIQCIVFKNHPYCCESLWFVHFLWFDNVHLLSTLTVYWLYWQWAFGLFIAQVTKAAAVSFCAFWRASPCISLENPQLGTDITGSWELCIFNCTR